MSYEHGYTDEWYHTPFRTHASKSVPRKYRRSLLPEFMFTSDGLWLKRYKFQTAIRRNERPGPAPIPAFQIRRAIRKIAARAAMAPSTCPESEHEWNNEGNDPTECLKCGMSFTRHIFTECF